jgi:cation transport ATPase
LEILNNQAGRLLSSKTPERDTLVSVAISMYQKHKQHNIFLQLRDRNILVTFEQLLALITFFDLYYTGRYVEALTVCIPINITRLLIYI